MTLVKSSTHFINREVRTKLLAAGYPGLNYVRLSRFSQKEENLKIQSVARERCTEVTSRKVRRLAAANVPLMM